MYQVSIALGKSAGTDVSILQVPIATVTPAASVALLIGESTTLTYGQIMIRLSECVDELIESCKRGAGLQKVAMNPAVNGKPSILVSASDGLAAEAAVGAVCNAAGTLDGQTGLVSAGLVQCMEVFRETVLTGGLTIKP
jgi:hypothetical protein